MNPLSCPRTTRPRKLTAALAIAFGLGGAAHQECLADIAQGCPGQGDQAGIVRRALQAGQRVGAGLHLAALAGLDRLHGVGEGHVAGECRGVVHGHGRAP